MIRLFLAFLIVLCFDTAISAQDETNQAQSRTQTPKQKLNVLFIAVDDLRVELGCYGQSPVQSPHIDQLAKQGTLFTNAYCQQTVCNPSRASMLTGLRPDTIRVWDLQTHFRQAHPNAITLPQLFKQNGYHTQAIGKVFHNRKVRIKGQDDVAGDPQSWSVLSTMHIASHYDDKPVIEGQLPLNLTTLTKAECRDVPDNAYFDGRVATAAINALQAITRDKDKDQPFFLAVGFWKPHLPFNAPKKHWDLYDRSQIPLPFDLTPPRNVPELALTKYRIDANKKDLADDDIRELHHAHLAAISYLDAQIGRLLAALDALNLREKTIIVFWSDHGLHLGEHGLWSKTTAFDLDARVPLIITTPPIATPNHKPGQRTDALVELIDIYPTLADLCQLSAPLQLQGVSLRSVLENPHNDVKPVALTQTPRPNYPRGKTPAVMGYSIRTKRYRYTEWRDYQSAIVKARELYDHLPDPAETNNVVNVARYKKTVAQLGKQLQATLDQHQNQ